MIQEPETIGAIIATLVIVLINLLVVAIRTSTPSISKFVKKLFDIKTEKAQHEQDMEEQEDQLSAAAKSFLTQFAQENIVSMQQLAQERKKELDEIRRLYNDAMLSAAELRANDMLKAQEIELLKSEVVKAKETIDWTNQSLKTSREEIAKLQVQLINHEREINGLKAQALSLSTQLQAQKTLNQTLESQLSMYKEKLESSIDENERLRERIKLLEELNTELKEQIVLYQDQIKQFLKAVNKEKIDTDTNGKKVVQVELDSLLEVDALNNKEGDEPTAKLAEDIKEESKTNETDATDKSDTDNVDATKDS